MKLHQRGLDLLLDVQDALQHSNKLSSEDVHNLLAETEIVLRNLLARDVAINENEIGRQTGTSDAN